MVSDARDRGQLILVAAIAVAFVVLGIVVVFNGVLFTQAISGEGTVQTEQVDTVDLEVERGICGVIERVDPEVNASANPEAFERNVSAFADAHRNVTVESRSTLVTVSDVEVEPESPDGEDVSNVTATVTYDSTDVAYERTRTIETEDCR